ncbi:MAG: CoA pyrophosphatase [Betaproteobacteria bacterium]|nr:CoA pyrophosphatase [Betaproteobacteria bacterium]
MKDLLSADWLRRQFATARAPSPSVYGDEGARPAAGEFKPAAVLLPIVARGSLDVAQLTMLFTRRAAHLKDHSGQVSFPGGRVALHDPSPEATALREAREEIGLDPDRVELLGRMPEYHTRTGFRITPVVGIVTPPFELQADAGEVEEIFEVPLAFLLDPANHQRQSREWQGELRWFFAMPYEQHYIWGATAGMLVNLSRHLAHG